MSLEAEQAGADASELQQALFDPHSEAHTDRGHVPDDLILRLLEGKVDRPLTTRARRIAELRGEGRFSRARGAADQHRAAAIRALAAKHQIQTGNAGRYPLGRYPMLQTERGDRLHRHAVFPDQERILIGAVQRTAVLQDPKPPDRRLLSDEMIE